MKSTKVQTLGTSHAIVYTEYLGGSEDTRHHLQWSILITLPLD